MIVIRPAAERGHANHGWLDTHHTFSFGQYHDEKHMGFRALRVINDDIVAPGEGFGTHPHRDMEIVTCVIDGELEHKDSMGTGSVIQAGEVQHMSAGTGVTHSEFNPSKEFPVRLLQIWIQPAEPGIEPSYDQKAFPVEGKSGRLCLIASADGRDESLTIRQDVSLYATLLGSGETVGYELDPTRHAWVQVVRGSVRLNGRDLEQGDGAAISEESRLTLEGIDHAEVLLFDLA